jgi:hypothetical protein
MRNRILLRRIVVRIRPPYQRLALVDAFNLTRWGRLPSHNVVPVKAGTTLFMPPRYPTPRIIALRASASPISTKAEVTSGPPTKMRVGVFILFHS